MFYVYFIKAEKTNLIKIGRAINPPKRLKHLQSGCPDKLTLLGMAPEISPHTEREIHEQFFFLRKHGEWFEESPSLIDFMATFPKLSPNIASVPGGRVLTSGAIGNAIKGHRKRAKMTQQDLAEAAHVSRQFVIDVERGKPRAEIGKVMLLVQVLDINIYIEPI